MSEQEALPQLSGTEKQVAWAQKLRTDRLAELETERALDDLIAQTPATIIDRDALASSAEELRERFRDLMAECRTHISQNETSAEWWIDKRWTRLADIFTVWILNHRPEVAPPEMREYLDRCRMEREAELQ